MPFFLCNFLMAANFGVVQIIFLNYPRVYDPLTSLYPIFLLIFNKGTGFFEPEL